MKKTRLLSLLLAVIMIASLAACSSNSAPATSAPATSAPATSAPATSAPETAAPAPTEEVRTAPKTPTVVRIGCGPLTGQQNATYNGIADLINKDLPGFYSFLIEGTTGSAENARLLAAGEVDFGTMGLDFSVNAYNGTGDFAAIGAANIRQVIIHPSTGAIVHVIVPKDSSINTMEDLKGKKVAATAGAMQGYLEDALYGHDMSLDDLGSLVNLSLTDCMNALQDRTIDAFCYGNTAPNANFTDLATSFGFKLIDVGDEAVAKIMERKPWFHKEVIKAGTYPGVDYDITSFAQYTILCCRGELPDEVVYDMVSTICDQAAAVGTINKAWAKCSAETVSGQNLIPYHNGAAKYFAEHGITVEHQ